MKILITGGAGYIGSHVCHLLIDQGYNVTCIDSLITGNKELLPKEVKLEIFDISNVVKKSDIIFVPIQTPHEEKYEGITRIPKERADFNYKFLILNQKLEIILKRHL